MIPITVQSSGFFRPAEVDPSSTDNRGLGVLEMTLSPDQYSWRFVPLPGAPKADSGSATCV